MMKEFYMKKKNFLGCAGLILAVAGVLVFSGCSKGDDDVVGEVDPGLKGSWTNDPDGTKYTDNFAGFKKEFTINPDNTFVTTINVVFLGAVQQAAGSAKITIDLNNPTSTDPTEDATIKAVIADVVSTMGGITAVDSMKWTVRGTLVPIEGDIYKMENLSAEGQPMLVPGGTGTIAPTTAVAAFGGAGNPVKLEVKGPDSFIFKSGANPENVQINAFFGGSYYRTTK
jgi:hypothetical protein